MSMHPAIMMTTTVARGLLETTNSILAYKQAIHAIDAQLAQAELYHQQELQKIKADGKQTRQKIKAQQQAFKQNAKSFEMDKQSLRKQLKLCTKRAMDFSLSVEERQEAKEMARFISEQLDNVRADQHRSQAQLSDNLNRVKSNGGFDGQVIDADFEEC